jgi:hypothetical protein
MLVLCIALTITGVGSTRTPLSVSAAEGVDNPCAATTDAEIVAAIHAKIKADQRFNDQWKKINISSTNRVVTVSGWTRQPNTLLAFAKNTKCVRRTVNHLTKSKFRVGCENTQKQCGDICIDRSEQCNLIQDGGGPPQ